MILQVCEVKDSGVLLLEGRDGKLSKDHTRNCAPCYLPHIDGTTHPSLSHIFDGLLAVCVVVPRGPPQWFFV